MDNLGSLLNMFKRIEVKASVEADPEVIRHAEKIVLPGVGAFDAAMARINGVPGLLEVPCNKALAERVPVLGVCLGMQLLTRSSEEGVLGGLNWIPGNTQRFPKQDGLKVPHMGWNIASLTTPSALTQGVDIQSCYYFVHSYCVQVDEPAHSLMRAHYGLDFEAAIGRDNVYGVQFHPEKSHRFGMQILRNFAVL
jgi:imidazole glycerol-phosphate synthase subunit HisH